jgi:catechol 2,3-dioxygenase-like lactoylglutathione lyase family enzyme
MITGQVHTGITVSDLDKSIAFYRDILGFKLIKVEPVKRSRGEKLGVPGAVIQVAVLEYADGCSVELIHYLEPQPPNSYNLPINAIGQVHIAFRVDDIKSQIAKMTAHRIEFVGGPEVCVIDDGPLAGWKWIYFKDPDGTNLELIEGNLRN